MKWSSKYTAQLAILTSFTISFELIGLPQPITGPFINAILLLTAMIINTTAGVLLGCITPIVALLRGQLPAALASIVPCIILANAILVIIFCKIHTLFRVPDYTTKRYLINTLALFCASLCKFLLLAFSAKILLPIVFGTVLPEIFITAMTFPQFFTAMVGGIFALFLFKLLTRLTIIKTHSLY